MNQVALVGNITGDPELCYTQSGRGLHRRGHPPLQAQRRVAGSHRLGPTERSGVLRIGRGPLSSVVRPDEVLHVAVEEDVYVIG